jgi:hypothetical protein
MPSKKEFLERRHFFSDRISSQVRIVSIGILATAWGLLTETVKLPNTNIESLSSWLILTIVGAILAVCCDALQYVCAYINVHNLLSEMENKGLQDADYNYDSNAYKLSDFFFRAKQVLLGATALLFIVLMFTLI